MPMTGKESPMPRGAKDAKPAKAKIEAELAAARKALKQEASRRRKADKHLAELLEQQTATSEILRVISRSQTDVQPVFDTIVRSAVRLCAARFGAVFRFDGEMLHLVVHHNFPPNVLEFLRRQYPMRPGHA